VTPAQVEALLAEVASGQMTPESALRRLRHLPFEDLRFARVDHHRHLRQGQSEVVFCAGKTVAQVVAICERLAEHAGAFLGTRATDEMAAALRGRFPELEWNALARTVHLPGRSAPATTGDILIVSAGTSDLPVAEEAAVTAAAFGC
jgi:NCAIR mutase (PurE)-related protein